MSIDRDRACRSAAKLLKTTGSLHQIVSTPKKHLTRPEQKRLTTLTRQLKSAQSDLEFALSGGALEGLRVPGPPTTDQGGVPSTFDDFFSAVATSFANAQQNLDQRTKEYLAGIQDQKEFLPTAFRIAKVSADMKFAVESVDSKSVGVIFFKDTSSTDIQNQQQVHFEMVAAPTPPGATFSAPSIPLLFSKAKRDLIFDIITKQINVAGDQTGSANLLIQPKRVLIFPEKLDRIFYLAYADAQKSGLWLLDSTVPKLTVMRGFANTSGTALDAARNTLLQLGTLQESFLNSIG